MKYFSGLSKKKLHKVLFLLSILIFMYYCEVNYSYFFKHVVSANDQHEIESTFDIAGAGAKYTGAVPRLKKKLDSRNFEADGIAGAGAKYSVAKHL